MLVEQFLPYYPSVDDEKEFNDQLYRKKEFYENKLSTGLPNLTESGYLQHQVIIARFLSPHTLYNGIFLFHEAGSGKTAATIGVCEEFFKSESRIRKALVLVSNELLEKRFLKEIIHLGPQYAPNDDDIQLENPRQREDILFQRAKRKVRERYQLETFSSFYTRYLKKTTPANWAQTYSNHIIIFDEVHKLVGQEGTSMYDTYLRFFHSLHNSKLIVMSGTPMRNDAVEFARILNLILPETEKLPTTSSEFDAILTQPEFIQRITGRVSYLKTQTNIPKMYIGEVIPPIDHFILYPSQMSQEQLTMYQRSFASDSGWYTRSRQVSQFSIDVTSQSEFRQLFRGKRTREEKLTVLEMYSSKYASAVRSILDRPKENVFVFTSFIEPPGAVVFGWCLELFGFQPTLSGKETSPGARYAILSETGERAPNIDRIIDQFNRRDNNHGKYIRVLIGGTKVSVGVTFKNIQQIHILTPTWHYSAIDQTIARGVRYRSHSGLPANTPVRIFLHVSVSPALPPEETVDLIMYDTAQKKDVSIKYVEYLAKTHAMDCALTYHRNLDRRSPDGSRECEYQQCRYTCYGIPITGPPRDPYRLSVSDLDRTTYELYYSTSDVTQFHAELQPILQKESMMTLPVLYQQYKEKYSLPLFLKLLYLVIAKKLQFYDSLGMVTYLQYQEGVVFLVQNGVRDTALSDSFYQTFPVNQIATTTMHTATSVLRDFIDTEFTAMNLNDQILTFQQFPLTTQTTFIEQAIQGELEFKEDDVPNAFGRWLLGTYENEIERRPGTVRFRNRVLHLDSLRWSEDTEPERARLTPEIVEEFPVYGILNNGVLNLIDNRRKPIHKRKLDAKGQNCATMRKESLVNLLTFLGVTDRPRKRKEICTVLNDQLAQRNLLF